VAGESDATIHLTDEMVEPGVRVLRFHLGVWDRELDQDRCLIKEIWAMLYLANPLARYCDEPRRALGPNRHEEQS